MRSVLKGLAGLILLLVVFWLGLWLYAEMRLKQLVSAQIARINQSGAAQVTYDKLTGSHNPLVAAVTLVNPVWSASPPGAGGTPGFRLAAARLGAHVDLRHPFLLHVDLPPRLDFDAQGFMGALTFAMADVTEHLSPGVWVGNVSNPVTGGEARFAAINLLGLDSTGSLQIAQIDTLAAREDVNVKAGPDKTALALDWQANGARLSTLFVKLFNAPYNGEIAHLEMKVALSGPLLPPPPAPPGEGDKALIRQLHQWALAGGNGRLAVKLTLGPSQIQADGTVKFDAQAQPSGTGDLTADHLDQLSATLTQAWPFITPWVTNIQARLAPYLSTSPAAGQVLTAHGRYGRDGVFLNDQRMGDMSPLDWNGLLTPPSATVAPGDGSGAASP